MRIHFLLAGLILLAAQTATVAWGADVKTLGLKGDGTTDDTEALQKALGEGGVELVFSRGTYLLGTVDLPSNVTLRAEAGAKIRINPPKLRSYGGGPANRRNLICLFALRGRAITIQNVEFDFSLVDGEGVLPAQRPGTLIMGKNVERITLDGLVAERGQFKDPIPVEKRKTKGVGQGRFPKSEPNRTTFHLSTFEQSSDLVLRNSRAKFMNCMIDLHECSRIWSFNNQAFDGYAITRARSGNQYLWHGHNWSRNVNHQCRWFGGNANDTRNLKEGSPGWGTATTVKRGSMSSDPGFNRYTQGEYDVMVVNNYAEYGQTLAWGSKGRQILFQGNTARFMTDYALGSEGGEEVIFKGNTTVNSYTAGLVAMYWSEKLVIEGNLVLVKDEPIDMQYSSYSTPAPYQGGLLRLHAAGSPSKSGAGQVIISGNLLVNELSDRPRRIGIEAGRDVFITGNKIINGGVRTKNGSGKVVLSNNDFTMNIPHVGAWINIAAGVTEATVAGNVFRNTRPLDARSPTESLMVVEADTGKGSPRLRVIERNQIQGFPLAIWGRALSKTTEDRFLIRGNSADGVIRMEGLGSAYVGFFQDNINLQKMEPLQVEKLDRRPVEMPPSVPTPDDKAEADSDGTAQAEASAESEEQ